ncbi:MAG: tRNA guanosine(34) transglycosylase Tgt [Candidatus Sungbacteria bacterium]|nr:tRNA guanosine(34) transglycosylase Tgt [bacterium]MDZ4285478.1 tRNA guanosine(34) transglycosylase Tgt [Candidatus Sungbacteria bacterium]
MIEFSIQKKSKKSHARIGILKTPHGEVETPSFVPVATQATVKTLTSAEVLTTKTQILIANTYHLHLKPGEKIVKAGGGLHTFMQWPGPLMTDSGGFQVFSLGFGKDFGTGKILKQKHHALRAITTGQQPKLLKITDDGVWFTSFLDGKKLFLNPEKSVRIQEALGADIIFAFDECTSPIADHAYTKKSMARTHVWARQSLDAQNTKQSMYGIVQGGKFKDLRIESARFIRSLPFDGFGIGGEFGDHKQTMTRMLNWVIKELPEQKPRHLLGIGYLEDIPKIIASGVDTFDCTLPTHAARHGIAFTSKGKIDILKSIHLKDTKPLDPRCECMVCSTYTRSYLCHLMRAKEITALRLLTSHNLYFFNTFVESMRTRIKQGKL